jgi:hypothetical protein
MKIREGMASGVKASVEGLDQAPGVIPAAPAEQVVVIEYMIKLIEHPADTIAANVRPAGTVAGEKLRRKAAEKFGHR